MQEKNTLMGVLAYLGILVLIPLFVAKDDPFVRFHVRQGLVLFIIDIVAYVLWVTVWPMFWMLWPLYNLINLGICVLVVIGIINVVRGDEKELPIVGDWGKGIKI